MAATRHNLLEFVQTGRVRDDLYYHLNVVSLRIPPLRDHPEDVADLLDYYAERFPSQEGLPRRRFSLAAQKRLRAYGWPGNVRELKNLVRRLLILGSGALIEAPEIDAVAAGGGEQRTDLAYRNSPDTPLTRMVSLLE